eukprot:364772-Chlamydomonas_euryale.AAC.19
MVKRTILTQLNSARGRESGRGQDECSPTVGGRRPIGHSYGMRTPRASQIILNTSNMAYLVSQTDPCSGAHWTGEERQLPSVPGGFNMHADSTVWPARWCGVSDLRVVSRPGCKRMRSGRR